MAESEWLDQPSHVPDRFFCHICDVEVMPQLPDYSCPRCQSGFIEIFTDANRHEDSDSSNDMDTEFWELIADSNNSSRNAGVESSQSTSDQAPSVLRRSQRFRHTLHPRHGRRRAAQDRQQSLVPLLQDLVMQVTGVIEASVGGSDLGFPAGAFEIPMLVTSNLASNPGDYAWGRGGLDAIITQLMNQLDGTGPPPLPQEKINLIPTVKISQEQCDKNLQCTVCMEDYRLDESVRKLNCDHCYHDDCIIPWLQLHGTCPVCRKALTIGEIPNHQNDMQMFFAPSDQMSSDGGRMFEDDSHDTTTETITVEDNPSDDLYSTLHLTDDDLD